MTPGDEHPLVLLERWLSDAGSAGEPAPTECVLATAARDGSPSARMVSVKEVTSRGLTFVTQDGTRKAHDLKDNPRCCFVFWWPRVKRQVRVACQVEQLQRDETARLFSNRPREHQVASIVSAQGSEIADLQGLRDAATRMLKTARDTELRCPDTFLGYLAIPHAVEFWTQGPARLHERIEYRLVDGEWQARLLAP